MERQPSRRLLATAALAAALAAPGSAVAAGADACANADAAPGAVAPAALQAATLCLVNRERAAAGRRSLRASTALTAAAIGHSRDMVRRRYFDHTSPEGRDLADRVLAAGWATRRQAWRVGENIAWGTGRLATPRATVTAWMNSPGHRRNMLDGRFREAGVGAVPGVPASTRGNGATYTLDFGARG